MFELAQCSNGSQYITTDLTDKNGCIRVVSLSDSYQSVALSNSISVSDPRGLSCSKDGPDIWLEQL